MKAAFVVNDLQLSGGVGVVVCRPRTLSQASFTLSVTGRSLSHPEMATVISAQIASVLRRIASLQR